MSITEFSELDPQEIHLVSNGASGFPILLAKAVDDSMDAEMVKACGVDGCAVCADAVSKRKLKAADRKALPKSDFAIPEKAPGSGSYPIPDESHARDALARSSGKDVEGRVKAAVHRKYPDMEIDGGDAEKQTAPDKSVSQDESLSQTREVDAGPGTAPAEPTGQANAPSVPLLPPEQGDGQGSAPASTSLPEGEAESQTRDNIEGIAKADSDGGGDTASDSGSSTDESESQTRENAEKADGSPGSPGWESHDASLAAEIGDLAGELEQREKAEGTQKGAEGTGETPDATNNHTSVSKEIEDMTHDELMKLLDEREAARRARKQEKKLAKAKAEEEAASAAKSAEEETAKAAEDEAAKAEAPDEIADLRAQLAKATERVDAMEAKRPFVNGVGAAAILRQPEAAATVFKALDDRVAAAQEAVSKANTAGNDYARQRAQSDLDSALKARAGAKMVAADNAREKGQLPRGRFGPNSADLFGGSTLSLPDDRAVKGF